MLQSRPNVQHAAAPPPVVTPAERYIIGWRWPTHSLLTKPWLALFEPSTGGMYRIFSCEISVATYKISGVTAQGSARRLAPGVGALSDAGNKASQEKLLRNKLPR